MSPLSPSLFNLFFTGTIVAMEKVPGILKEEHKAIVEAERDNIERDLNEWRINNKY